MITQLMEELTEITEREVARAERKHPAYTSDHEAYAVLLEEYEEVKEELEKIHEHLAMWWVDIKYNDTLQRKSYLKEIFESALCCASESLQVAAVACRAGAFKDEKGDKG